MNENDILKRRVVVASLYLQGHTRDELAVMLGVSQGTVSNDLASVRKLWAEQAAEGAAELRAEELAKLKLLESVGWRAQDHRLVLKAMDHRAKLLGLYKGSVLLPGAAVPWEELAREVLEGPPRADPAEARLLEYEEPTDGRANGGGSEDVR